MRVPSSSGVQTDLITEEQVAAIRSMAHEYGYLSIALTQAMQFELGLSQKDIIGEWVPVDEPGESTIVWHGKKWRRGIVWSNIDSDLMLRHFVGHDQRQIVLDLKTAPMTLREIHGLLRFRARNEALTTCEATAMPWVATEFRRKWRLIADFAGIPPGTRNISVGPPKSAFRSAQ
jgi:hypothetical protein